MNHRTHIDGPFTLLTWGCFTEDTEIWMADKSLKLLSQLQKGDQVLSWFQEGILYPDHPRWNLWTTDSIDRGTIVSVDVIEVEHLIDDRILIINDNIKITKDHPVLCKKKDKDIWSWELSQDLTPYDTLLNYNNEPVLIGSCVWETGQYSTINLTVSNQGTYCVGKQGIVVHNFDVQIKNEHNNFISNYMF